MRFQHLLAGLTAVPFALLLSVLSASATPLTYDISFTTGAFNHSAGPGGAVSGVTGDVHLTMDTSQSYGNGTTTGISLIALSAPVVFNTPISFTYPITIPSHGTDNLVIGAAACSTECVTFGTNDFYFQIEDFSTAPKFLQFGFTLASGDYYYTDQGNGSVTVTPLATTPIPAALPLFISGLGGLGFMTWFRKRTKTLA